MPNQLAGGARGDNESFFRSVNFTQRNFFAPLRRGGSEGLRLSPMRRSPRTAKAAPSLLLLMSSALSGAGCEGGGQQTTDAGAVADAGALICTVQPPTLCPDPPPHYADVQPIFQSRCVDCHNGMPGGPWPLLQYSHVADWQDVVRAHLLACTMPPPDAGVPMTDDERTAILTWILCGYLE
jgi:hypothetical protein